MEKVNVVAYCRVSTDSTEQESSFENQQSYFTRELGKNSNYELIKIYADQGLTGTKLNNRPEFNQMLYDAGIDVIKTITNKLDGRNKAKHFIFEASDREPKFNEIWMKNTSRFARNTLSYEIITLLRSRGVYVYFVEQSIHTKNEKDDFLLKLFQLFDEQDSRDKSLKVIAGKKESARKGNLNINGTLYGYDFNNITKELTINDEEAEVIKKMFELYSENIGYRRILKYLETNNIKTRANKSFYITTVEQMLVNEKYAGILIRNKLTFGTVFNKTRAKLKDEDQWIIHKDKIPAIISEELFNKCKNIKENKVDSNKKKGIYAGVTKYAGKIFCGNCGGRYVASGASANRYYICTDKKANGTHGCNNPNVYEKKFNDEIEKLCDGAFYKVIKLFMNKEISNLKVKQSLLKLYILGDSNLKVNIINTKKEELHELNIQAEKLLDVYLEGKVTKEIYTKKIESLNIDINVLNNDLDNLGKDINDVNDYIERIDSLILDFNNIINSSKITFTVDEIMNEIDKIYIYKSLKSPELNYFNNYDFEELNLYLETVKNEDVVFNNRNPLIYVTFKKINEIKQILSSELIMKVDELVKDTDNLIESN